MKIRRQSRHLEDGTIEPMHEVDIVCAHCQDPVSAAEESTGVCTNCGEPWQAKQSVKIWATSVPWASGGVM